MSIGSVVVMTMVLLAICSSMISFFYGAITREREIFRDMRPEVIEFAKVMENKLKANDWKGGWENISINELLKMLKGEVEELEYFLEEHIDHEYHYWVDRMVPETADVANFAMMIYDNIINEREKVDK